MNITELEKLANDAWIGDDEDAQIELQFQGEAISNVIGLLREMGEALNLVNLQINVWDGVVRKVVPEVLAKYKEMME